MTQPADAPSFTKAGRNRAFALGVAVGAVVLLGANLAIGATVDTASPQPTVTVTVSAQPDQPSDSATQQGIGVDLARRIDGDPTAIGPVDAPVVMVAYADYRCPFCSLFEQQTLPTIVADYVDRGLLRYEFRDMPLFGQHSLDAAVAGRAAGSQGKFWAFMSAVSANGVVEGGHPDLPRERLIGFAELVGVPDMEQFEADLDDPELLAAVQRDFAEGRQLGLSSVPAFLVGDTPVVGAQPIEVFERAIDQELDEAGIIR